MTEQERIEKLQDRNRAQPFWLRNKEEQAVLVTAGPKNCLCLSHDDPQGFQARTGPTVTSYTERYILKPDYKPEPEYIEIEIEIDSEGMCVLKESVPGCDYKMLWWAESHKDFVCFHDQFDNKTNNAGNVPSKLRGQTSQGNDIEMVARFIKETS